MPLAGRPLSSRIQENLSRSGIKVAIIVIGYHGELIKQAIGNVSTGIKISYIENPEWRQDNLFSLIALENRVNRNFVLCMSDHIFDFRIVKNLIQNGFGEG